MPSIIPNSTQGRKAAKSKSDQGFVLKLESGDGRCRTFHIKMPASTDINKLLAMLAGSEALDWGYDGERSYLINIGKVKVGISFAGQKEIVMPAEDDKRQSARRTREEKDSAPSPIT